MWESLGSPGSPGSPGNPRSPGSPSSRRRSVVSPILQPSLPASLRGGFLGLRVDRGGKSPSQDQQKASERTTYPPAYLIRLIEEGDQASFEKLVSMLPLSERRLVFTTEIKTDSEDDNPSAIIPVAIKRGELSLLEAVLKWIPMGQAATVLMKKDNKGRTPLMLAAATGNTALFNAVATRLSPADMLEHLSAQCVMGNSIFTYGVQSGRAEMIEAVVARFSANQVVPVLCVKNFVGETPLVHAVRAPGPEAFRVIASILPSDQVSMQLEAETEEGHTALTIATRTGVFPIWKEIASRLPALEVNRQLSMTDVYGENAIMLSIRSGSEVMFISVVRRLKNEQLLAQLGARNVEGQTPAQVAVICDAKTILAAMLRPAWVGACMLDVTDDTEAHLTVLDLAAKPPAKFDILRCLLASGATPTGRMVLRLARNCCDDGSQENDTLGGRNGLASFASVRDCFLGAIAASDWPTNPLIPGLNLSVALIEAVRQSPDFRQPLLELRVDVDALVLSVLKHLPDTVAGFNRFSPAGVTPADLPSKGVFRMKTSLTGLGGVEASLSSTVARGQTNKRLGAIETAPMMGSGVSFVQEMLEPELAGLRAKNCAGPLAQAVQFRHQEFICSPLVVDYLRLKFSAGLPNPFRETDWRRENGRTDRDLARFMLDEDESKLMVYVLQGGCADSPSWTYSPGMQFILAGLVGKTAAFFGVPAIRLALDVMVYSGVITVFVLKVVVIKDAGVLTPWELLWLIYVIGAIGQQLREVEETGSIRTHFSNPWNNVETATLVSVTTALAFRMWAFVCDGRGEHLCGERSGEVNEVYLAQYFQAASAPFVLGKVLFLTQIHSSLGPLMHSLFQMLSDLARFGALMVVFILGFALAFYSLFGSTSVLLPDGGEISNFDTYSSSLLTLFGSMLGTFDFTVFSGAPMADAGVILFVLFLCLMNVTLLNLLIAILATTHAKVEGNADKEAVLSEALIITQYRRAMRSDSLPSPLNVPQELICHLFWWNKERAKELFARGMFWLLTGPVAIAATAVLWAVSLPLTLAWAARVLRTGGPLMIVPSILGISFNLGVAPLLTAWIWLSGVTDIWYVGDGIMEMSDLTEIEASRAYRRRNYAAGSPNSSLAKIACAAIAAKGKTSSSVVAAMEADATANAIQLHTSDDAQGRKGDNQSKGASRMWQEAAVLCGVGPADGSDAEGSARAHQQGFNVAMALRASHGLTVQQLKEALDGRFKATDQVDIQRREKDWSESLASVTAGQKRLEENIQETEKSRARMEAKLDQLITALQEKNGRGCVERDSEIEKSPATSTPDSMSSSSVTPEGEERARGAKDSRGRSGSRPQDGVAAAVESPKIMEAPL